MKPKFIQVDVREEINTRGWTKPDYRQANAVLKYRPDIIIFEDACGKTPDTIYNKFDCKNKPVSLINDFQRQLKKIAKEPGMGDAASDIELWENIKNLWRGGQNVLLYDVDGPKDLRREFFEVWKYMYPCALKNWLWWVRIYLREKYMCKNVEWVLNKNKKNKNLTIAIFLQSFHWEHVEFLLKKPSKKEIWKYYFAKFKEVGRQNISAKIKKNNNLFYRHWRKISDFN